MEVVSLRPEHIDRLYEIYLAQVERAPHCRFAPNRARFRDDLLGHSPSVPALFDPPEQTHTFVAEDAGIAQGIATLTTFQQDSGEQQAITGLFFDSSLAGEALLRACEVSATATELLAFPAEHGNTPIHTYNAGWDGLSDRVPHVAQLLSKHGYTPYFRELHLSASLPLVQRQTSAPLQDISLMMPDIPPDYEGIRVVRAMDGDSRAGICTYTTLELLTDDEAAARIGYIWWLHVEESHRRRGIARALMESAANLLMTMGCTSLWLTTTADNWNAQSLYYSLGFEVVDASVSFRKRIGS